jgi:hypothetical protein
MIEFKSNVEEDGRSADGPVTGRENDVGDVVGIESSVGRAHRRTCLPII